MGPARRPVVWALLEQSLTGEPAPADAAEAAGRLHECFRKIVGVDLTTTTEETAFREEFDEGGMSDGHVAWPVWRDRLMPMLLRRARGQLGDDCA